MRRAFILRAAAVLILALAPSERLAADCQNPSFVRGGRERYEGTLGCGRVFRRGKDLPEINLDAQAFPQGTKPFVNIYLNGDTTLVAQITKFNLKEGRYVASWDWSNLRRWNVPAQVPVGRYDFYAYRWTGQTPPAPELLGEWAAFVVFEKPTDLNEDDEKAFAYSTGKKPWRDDESVQVHYDIASRKVFTIAGKKVERCPKWYEMTYPLNPFTDEVFIRALFAVHAQTSPAAAAERLMKAVSNVIFYADRPNRHQNVAKMVEDVSLAQFTAAAGGTESQYMAGQCLDYAHALAAMYRSVGMPARVATDVESGSFDYHVWTEVFLASPPGGGEDKWYTYDAMDYTPLPHTAAKDLLSPPIGKAARSSAHYGRTAYEVVVGRNDWKTEPGKMEMNFTTKRLTRVSDADDQLFEKCDGHKYDTTGCPAPFEAEAPPRTEEPSPYVSVEVVSNVVRVGDSVQLAVHLTNPDPLPRSTDLRFILGHENFDSDMRDSYGDPVLETTGTGIFGTAVLDQVETGIVVPPGGEVLRSFQATVTSDAAARQWLAEARITSPSIPTEDLASAPVTALAAYDVSFDHPTLAHPADSIFVSVTLQNQVAFALANLHVTLAIPESYGSSGPLSVEIPLLAVGASYPLGFNLEPIAPLFDAQHDFRLTVTSDNGGEAAVSFVQDMIVPATLAIPGQAITPADGATSFPVSFTLQNLGDQDTTDVTVHLQPPDGLPPGSFSLAQDVFLVPSLPGGSTVMLATNATWSGLDSVHVQAVADGPGGLTTRGLLKIRYADSDGDETPDASDCAPDDGAIHPGAPEACDGVDNDCDGSLDTVARFTQTIVFSNKTVLSWSSSQLVDVIRGNLSALRSSGGLYDGTVEICLLNNVAGTAVTDASVLAPGAAKYYLTRRQGTGACVHSWGTGAVKEMVGRDDEIPLDPDACP